MRPGLDLHALHHLMQGSRTYMLQLTQHLLELDQESEFVLYLPRRRDFDAAATFPHPKALHRDTPSSRVARLLTTFPSQVRRDRCDLLHVQYVAPPLLRAPYVVSLHDILHEVHPEFYPGGLRRLMSLLYPWSARRAARVLALSHHTRKMVMDLYGVPEQRVVTVWPGVSSEFRILNDLKGIAEVKRKLGIQGEYVLFVGRIEPRKNIRGLVEAWRLLLEQGDATHALVVAGMRDPLFADYHDETVKLAVPGKILFTGGVDQADLPLLYNGASLLAYPSFGEGFGLPVLEAMACGAPVLASNTTSLPEAVGEAGLMVNPRDVAEMARMLRRMLVDVDLRAHLRQRGLAHAATFTWRRAAEQVLAVYRDVAAGKGASSTMNKPGA